MEGLVEKSNLMEYTSYTINIGSLQSNPSTLIKYIAMLVPTPRKYDITGKISFSEITDMEVEEHDAIKILWLD